MTPIRRDPIGLELAEWGKVILLETRGRTSGDPTVVAVGFVEEPDGSLLVSASSDSTQWARNLLADPHCRVTLEGHARPCRAELLQGSHRNRAIAALILAYGTPAERLGAGPAFRLLPQEA